MQSHLLFDKQPQLLHFPCAFAGIFCCLRHQVLIKADTLVVFLLFSFRSVVFLQHELNTLGININQVCVVCFCVVLNIFFSIFYCPQEDDIAKNQESHQFLVVLRFPLEFPNIMALCVHNANEKVS